ncbi:NAD(P)/FAD-dependent oxidoreductase [Variovorax ginsengisoli]|uniref:FAD-dependent monooxygenase n=1 Tax=Variovorax ginsengisoli TaxID=363844 RepID=A0ABT8RX40_9BURK|nr:FAD-dependent monooxygenase [Variovorax ginsengisoli]MDN8612036.1 FAD-dependent monooxygenase [Variovorax ginsengisoli]MDO1531206.1 FAD-dependent monooxygenase [Variovorax ginsengisoli]
MTLSAASNTCEVLVIGAGPAGSACAQALAGAGLDVVLVDQHAFPRDKTCGDGLIPDAQRALSRLGLLDEVLARARVATHVGCVGPSGGRVELAARLAVLPRRELDELLRREAVAHGARWLAPARFEAPLFDADGRVGGARLALPDGSSRALRARWTVLATGAAAGPLLAAGVCERRLPSGIALRGYVRSEALAGRVAGLEVVWHRALRRGYGWIFPCRDGVFNIGVGLTRGRGAAAAPPEANLRELFDAFVRLHPTARELMATGQSLGPLKGAPLRCSLEGARWSRPGLLVAGEAAGSTYLLTGEGIGKALEAGLLAAQAIADGRQARAPDSAVRARYEAGLHALKPRFAAYEQANRINEHPWLADLVIWRARHSRRLVRQLGEVLEESRSPGPLGSAGGLLQLLLPLGGSS